MQSTDDIADLLFKKPPDQESSDERLVIPTPPPLPPPFIQRYGACPSPPSLPAWSTSRISKGIAALEQKEIHSSSQPKSDVASENIEPIYVFFYGSLVDVDVLQHVLGLPDSPSVKEAMITGFKVKMWGTYPALIPCANVEARVVGTVWKADKAAHFARLAAYETNVYTHCPVRIYIEGSVEPLEGRTFCWAKDPNSSELEEGYFDLERYRKFFKPSLLRKL